jgi:pimeloyl-ACP methyl ester carboxylesterase
VLVGNSMGGLISLMQSDADPGTVAGLVLLDPALPRPRGVRPDPDIVVDVRRHDDPRLRRGGGGPSADRLSPEERVAQTLDRCTVNPARVPPHRWPS